MAAQFMLHKVTSVAFCIVAWRNMCEKSSFYISAAFISLHFKDRFFVVVSTCCKVENLSRFMMQQLKIFFLCVIKDSLMKFRNET